MRETRIMIVTLMHRAYGPAIASWIQAIRYAEEKLPGVRFDQLLKWGNPSIANGDGPIAVLHKYHEAQQMFKAGGWWAMITIEDDMILPEDALVRLVNMLSGGADIGYGLYAFRHGRKKWSAVSQLNANGATFINHTPEVARASWGTVIDVAGVGLGCTALSRATVESVPFRKAGIADSDWWLALDIGARGLSQCCDLGLVCGHMSMTPSPRILWPDLDADEMVRVEFL